MIWKVYDSLHNFKFWGGAKDRADLLTDDELDRIENELVDFFNGIPTDSEINDLFWFDFDIICNMLGTTEDEVLTRTKEA